jgi:hypothetical protein
MTDPNIEKVVLYIDSSYRNTGVAENFTINLANQVQRVIYVELVSAEVPYTFYVVNNMNNTLVWSVGATPHKCTVAPGNYDTTDLLAALQAAMNAQSTGFTLTYNQDTYKMTFANAAAFTIDLTNASGTSTINPVIGLTAQTTLGTSTTMLGVVNIGGPKYLLIKSVALTQPKITKPFLNTMQADVLYKVSVAGSPGDVLIEKNVYTNFLKYGVRQTLKTLDFQLIDDQGNQLDLNFQNWSLTVNLILG